MKVFRPRTTIPSFDDNDDNTDSQREQSLQPRQQSQEQQVQNDEADEEEEKREEMCSLASAQIASHVIEAAAVFISNDQQDSEQTEYEGDLAMLKREAYWGVTRGRHQNNDTASHVHTSAVPIATNITSPSVHAHAELIETDIAQEECNGSVVTNAMQHNFPACIELNSNQEEEATEAVVIDSQFGDIPDWKVSGEAQVLDNDMDTSSMDDAKIPARATDISPYIEADIFASSRREASTLMNPYGQHAEVVDIQDDVHPSEYLNDVEAELVGHQEEQGADNITFAHYEHAIPYNQNSELQDDNVEIVNISLHPDEYDYNQDQTNLGRTVSSHTDNHGYASMESDQIASSADQHTHAIAVHDHVYGWNHPEFPTIQEYSGLVDVEGGDQVAEVLAIEESIHPSEFVGHHDAEAELMGTSPTYAVASLERVAGCQTSQSFGETAFASPLGSPSEARSIIDTEELISTPAAVISAHAFVAPDDDVWPIKPPRQSDPILATSTGSSHTDDYPGVENDVVQRNWPHETPPAEPFGTESRTSGSTFASERSNSTPTSQRLSNLHSLSSGLVRGTSNVMEALFGDAKAPFVSRRGRSTTMGTYEDEIASYVVPRTLLPWSVIFSPSTKMWVATLQTNQRALDKNNVTEASKSLRAFSLPTEKAALALAQAWTPPRMLPKANSCHICKSKFALLRRPCHCRNCGVVICKECSVAWPSKMIPETYNYKKENSVNVCLSCDWLSNNFRLALLEGNQDKAVAIYSTGNINLHAPFGNVKGELFYPVHCAVLGGSLDLLRWLVDDHCCPIKSLRVSGSGQGSFTPIVTSKGRSLLGIAMEYRNIEIVRYLVVRKGISLAGEQDITFEMLLRNLDRVLRLLPDDVTSADALDAGREYGDDTENNMVDPMVPRMYDGIEQNTPAGHDTERYGVSSTEADRQDDCIICFDSKIDCVATPCGHQVCCLKCSEHVTRCPVCSADCTFMRVFKP